MAIDTTCATCRSYRPGSARPEAAAYGVPAGQCRRYPTPVTRAPDDGCGEHSELEAERREDLARRLAHAIDELADLPAEDE